MYQYQDHDKALVCARVAEFRDQTRRFISGELDEESYRPLRLLNGLYIQRHAPMLRVGIPYGTLSSRQLSQLARVAEKYDRGYGHFTTRQNIQFNWLKLEEVPDVLEMLAQVDLNSIQTSGNCVRNITTDHLAGVASDEIEDPRPYCEIIRQWASLHPEFSYLPRKFKFAVTASAHDRAASQVHDIGLHLIHNDHGEVGFEVLVGGGLGRTPIIGQLLRDFLPQKDLLNYLDAILRVYNLHGRRDNIYKARIKILVKSMGIDAFRQQVETMWQQMSRADLCLTDKRIAAMKQCFSPPPPLVDDVEFVDLADGDDGFSLWWRQNTLPHKERGYRAVFLSLKQQGMVPGDMTAAQMLAVAELADLYTGGEIRTTHRQNLLFPHVPATEISALWRRLNALGLASVNITSINDMICCPGLDYCGLANAESISVGLGIQERFSRIEKLHELGPIDLNISGCMNACAHHHVGHIGILGVDKKGEQYYQIQLGGNSTGTETTLGDVLGPSLPQKDVPDVIENLVQVYLDQRLSGERFIEAYRRLGLQPFKDAIYAVAD